MYKFITDSNCNFFPLIPWIPFSNSRCVRILKLKIILSFEFFPDFQMLKYIYMNSTWQPLLAASYGRDYKINTIDSLIFPPRSYKLPKVWFDIKAFGRRLFF